jgi:fructose-1-phosphate kinase PfkB-like protein
MNALNQGEGIAVVSLDPTLDIIFFDMNYAYNQKTFANNLLLSPGGFGINVCRGLKQLGNNATLFTILGGHIGNLVESKLANENIDFRYLENINETRLTSIMVSNKSRSMLVSPSPQFNRQLIEQFINEFACELSKYKFVLFGGSFPNEHSDFLVDNLVSPLVEKKVSVVMDSRGTFAQRSVNCDLYAMRYNPIIKNMPPFPYLLIRQASKLYISGIPFVFFYVNKHCYAIFDEYIWKYPNHMMFTKNIANRIFGRGDAFIAGLIASLCSSKDKNLAICNAIACTAAFELDYPLGNISIVLLKEYLRKIRLIKRWKLK